jgi:hypothetical protein
MREALVHGCYLRNRKLRKTSDTAHLLNCKKGGVKTDKMEEGYCIIKMRKGIYVLYGGRKKV